MRRFDHERLIVYQKSMDFVVAMAQVISILPRGNCGLADQLGRAATSIVLNIAEGAGEFAGREKRRFYRMARRSATESAAALDMCGRLKFVDDGLLSSGREQLLDIVSMLVRMCREEEEDSWGTGKGKRRS